MTPPLVKIKPKTASYPVGIANLQMAETTLKNAAHALYDVVTKIRFATSEMDYYGKPHQDLDNLALRISALAFDMQQLQIALAVELKKELNSGGMA